MQPEIFNEHNTVDQWKGQPVYSLVQSYVHEGETHQWSITKWKLSIRERIRLLFIGRIWAMRTDRITVITVDKENLIS